VSELAIAFSYDTSSPMLSRAMHRCTGPCLHHSASHPSDHRCQSHLPDGSPSSHSVDAILPVHARRPVESTHAAVPSLPPERQPKLPLPAIPEFSSTGRLPEHRGAAHAALSHRLLRATGHASHRFLKQPANSLVSLYNNYFIFMIVHLCVGVL
jgi:hypothetical protein